MRISTIPALLLAFASYSSAALGGSPAEMSKELRENVLTALKGEAFAYVKYSLYAERAKQDGNNLEAARFLAAAQKERFEHFLELAEKYKLINTTEENLREAVAGETLEATKIYPSFARQAQLSGRPDIAEVFSELARDEAKHAQEFRSLFR